jgi:hypothetical protein
MEVIPVCLEQAPPSHLKVRTYFRSFKSELSLKKMIIFFNLLLAGLFADSDLGEKTHLLETDDNQQNHEKN